MEAHTGGGETTIRGVGAVGALGVVTLGDRRQLLRGMSPLGMFEAGTRSAGPPPGGGAGGGKLCPWSPGSDMLSSESSMVRSNLSILRTSFRRVACRGVAGVTDPGPLPGGGRSDLLGSLIGGSPLLG